MSLYKIIDIVHHDLVVYMPDFNPIHTFCCGQCFRWNLSNNNTWIGVVNGRQIELYQDGEYAIFKNMTVKEFTTFMVSYFDLNTNYEAIKNTLSKKDEFLKNAIEFGYGIRLLKQDFWETLISFIISQNNGINRIKQIIELLCLNFGSKIDNTDLFSFPSALQLALPEIEALNVCRGGYRVKYIKETASFILNNPEFLQTIYAISPNQAKEALLCLKGIGEKVADCILLFSGINMSSFPIDRWVKRVMETLYFDKETDIKTILKFSHEYFGHYTGIAQQYLFYYAREHKIGL